jgi:hypothetical protein
MSVTVLHKGPLALTGLSANCAEQEKRSLHFVQYHGTTNSRGWVLPSHGYMQLMYLFTGVGISTASTVSPWYNCAEQPSVTWTAALLLLASCCMQSFFWVGAA